jgi:hypothetical protein
MEKEKALELLRVGQRQVFNDYRTANPGWIPDFTGEDLSRIDLSGTSIEGEVNLDKAILRGVKFPSGANFLYNGRHPSLKDAAIDENTSGQELRWLVQLGAKLVSKDESSRSQPGNIMISYKTANRSTADELCKVLASAGLRAWMDYTGIEPGTQWRNELLKELRSCNAFLAL